LLHFLVGGDVVPWQMDYDVARMTGGGDVQDCIGIGNSSSELVVLAVVAAVQFLLNG